MLTTQTASDGAETSNPDDYEAETSNPDDYEAETSNQDDDSGGRRFVDSSVQTGAPSFRMVRFKQVVPHMTRTRYEEQF